MASGHLTICSGCRPFGIVKPVVSSPGGGVEPRQFVMSLAGADRCVHRISARRPESRSGLAPQVILHTGPQLLVREGEHAAVCVMNHQDRVRAEQPLGDDERAQGILCDATAGVADHVGIAQVQAEEGERFEPRVHAGHDGEVASGRHGELTLGEFRRKVVFPYHHVLQVIRALPLPSGRAT
jgi:hypothetical protein